MSVPRHEYDRNYVPIPGYPQASMVDLPSLPPAVFDALCVVRAYEAETAVHPTLLADGARAWFRHEQRQIDSASPRKDPTDG